MRKIGREKWRMATHGLKVLYFARVAELTHTREENLPLSAPTPATAWLQTLVQRYPQLAPVERLHIAVNQQHRSHSHVLMPGDEVALFDPVTGG